MPGTFVFSAGDPARMAPKMRQAFRNGWLGTESFGHSTLAQVATMTEAQFDEVVERLAAHFVAEYGAPSLALARPVARDEATYASGLCEFPPGTLLAIERDFADDGIKERVHAVGAGDDARHRGARAWNMVEDT